MPKTVVSNPHLREWEENPKHVKEELPEVKGFTEENGNLKVDEPLKVKSRSLAHPHGVIKTPMKAPLKRATCNICGEENKLWGPVPKKCKKCFLKLARVNQILDLFKSRKRAMTNNQIAHVVGMTPTGVRAYTKTLVDMGILMIPGKSSNGAYLYRLVGVEEEKAEPEPIEQKVLPARMIESKPLIKLLESTLKGEVKIFPRHIVVLYRDMDSLVRDLQLLGRLDICCQVNTLKISEDKNTPKGRIWIPLKL